MPQATRGRTLYCVFCGVPRDKTSCEKKCFIWPQFLQIPLEIQLNRTYKNRSVARGQQIMFEGDFPTKLQINVNGDFKLIANETDGEDNNPLTIKNIVTTPSFARTCESRITSCSGDYRDAGALIDRG